jgi:Adenylate and Guanylate cyclase catalytic domain
MSLKHVILHFTVHASTTLPTITINNKQQSDPKHGVLLGMSIKTTLSACESSIGISTGRVFCGIVGNDTRHEYAMVGDAINVAARLACMYEGDFIVDEEVRTFLRILLRTLLINLSF